MEPTTAVQPGGAGSAMMDCPQMMGPMGQMGEGTGDMGMMGGCPCMQMQQMMMGSPIGWVMMVATAIFVVAAIAALASLSVFLIRRSRIRVAP